MLPAGLLEALLHYWALLAKQMAQYMNSDLDA
jgi:hypothetical protein